MSNPKKSMQERLAAKGQKKLLALDGGGIRGLMSIEVLAAIENTLRDKLGAGDDFVLADYFDYVAGTSTGAIMATGISLGWPVDKLRRLYLENGEALFSKAGLLKRFRFMYEDDKLAKMLQQYIGKDTTLASDELRTLLMVVMRNASTDSPWPLSSNPAAKYNDPGRPDSNLRIPLWQLVRASTAAPVYFPPEVVDVGEHEFVFVDGGVTTYNNPAFILFLMATLEPYKLNWPAGEDNMLIVSVGTGTSPKANEDLDPEEMNLLYNVGSIPSALMFAALNEQDMLCRVFGRCRHGAMLDREIGDLMKTRGPVEPRLFTYMRYNAELTKEGLTELGVGDIVPEHVQKLDSVEYMDELQRVGKAVGEQQVRVEHFDGFE
jgi:hypothetical protein